MSTPPPSSPIRSAAGVLVVGAGISGIACARVLEHAGVPVRVVDRGRRPGGRMSGRTLHGRVVDLGASYFTVPEDDPDAGAKGSVAGFAAVAEGWRSRGLARPWTDTFTAIDVRAGAAPATRTTTGPVRWAAPGGLRSLVIDLAEGLDVELEHPVAAVSDDGTADGHRFDAVVLAVPEPQAVRMLAPDSALVPALDGGAWEPAIAVALGYPERSWPAGLHGAFVNDSPVLGFVADDGDRRGDGVPVLVAHTKPDFSHAHLAEPEGAIGPVIEAVTQALGLVPGAGPQPVPEWTHAHRWTFARAASTHPEPFLLRGRLAVCGDAWGGRSSVATAWASGDALGHHLAGLLA